MTVFHETLSVSTRGQKTYEITHAVKEVILKSKIVNGLVNIHCQHTSCSLVLMENADPEAREDLHQFMHKLVPQNLPYFTHTYEGPDDMPSHIKMALTRSSETIPLQNGKLLLGTWQGIFLWEHRDHPHSRRLIVTVMGD